MGSCSECGAPDDQGCRKGCSTIFRKKNPERFFLDSDGDGHWYLIPVTSLVLWLDFVDDPEKFDYNVPEGITFVNGHPSKVTFADPMWTDAR